MDIVGIFQQVLGNTKILGMLSCQSLLENWISFLIVVNCSSSSNWLVNNSFPVAFYCLSFIPYLLFFVFPFCFPSWFLIPSYGFAGWMLILASRSWMIHDLDHSFRNTYWCGVYNFGNPGGITTVLEMVANIWKLTWWMLMLKISPSLLL